MFHIEPETLPHAKAGQTWGEGGERSIRDLLLVPVVLLGFRRIQWMTNDRVKSGVSLKNSEAQLPVSSEN